MRGNRCVLFRYAPILFGPQRACIPLMAAFGAANAEVLSTDKPRVSPGVNRSEDLRLGNYLVALGCLFFLFDVVLTVHSYAPCPYQDGWEVLADLSHGIKPWNWSWLWQQHNEHRIVIPRLLIWLDSAAFGTRGLSLLVETYIFQLVHFFAVAFVIQRYAGPLSASLKRTLQGLFAVCFFYPGQSANFIWSFQVSFILSFLLTTVAILLVCHADLFRRRSLVLSFAAALPLVAGLNLAGGLLAGPVLLGLAVLKRSSRRDVVSMGLIIFVSFGVYLSGFHPGHMAPLSSSSLGHAAVYVLYYLDATWLPVPHRFPVFSPPSLLVLGGLVLWQVRRRQIPDGFSLFCWGECAFTLAVAPPMALSRIYLGLDTASQWRYQTVALLYWACLGSLVLLFLYGNSRKYLQASQQAIVIAATASLLLLPVFWSAVNQWGAQNQRACAAALRENKNVLMVAPQIARRL